jgi:hypothetical protein
MAADGRTRRTLRELPDHGEAPAEWRNWLTEALAPEPGYKVEKFLRHGRQRTDTCELVLVDRDRKRHTFEIEEQRFLSTPSSLRAAIAAATDGRVRPRRLTQAELEDVWIALVSLATVTANQSVKDETRERLEQTIEQAEELTGLSLIAAERPRAFEALLARNQFDYLAARRFTDPTTTMPPRPVLLIDSRTGERWMRVGEVATFWRHVLGCEAIAQPKIDGRLAAIGVRRHEYTFKPLEGSTRRLRLYRVGGAREAK